MRIFYTTPGMGFNHLVGFNPGIRSIFSIDKVIVCGGDHGRIQKMYLDQKNWLCGSPQIIDKEYYVFLRLSRKLMVEL